MPRSILSILLRISVLALFLAGYTHQLSAQFTQHHHEPCEAHTCEGDGHDDDDSAPDKAPSDSEDSHKGGECQGCHSCTPSACIIDPIFIYHSVDHVVALPTFRPRVERPPVIDHPHQPPQFAS